METVLVYCYRGAVFCSGVASVTEEATITLTTADTGHGSRSLLSQVTSWLLQGELRVGAEGKKLLDQCQWRYAKWGVKLIFWLVCTFGPFFSGQQDPDVSFVHFLFAVSEHVSLFFDFLCVDLCGSQETSAVSAKASCPTCRTFGWHHQPARPLAGGWRGLQTSPEFFLFFVSVKWCQYVSFNHDILKY
jgi:hypothetical protein